MLHTNTSYISHSHLDNWNSTVSIFPLNFSSDFNTINSPIFIFLKLSRIQMDPCLLASVSSYLTERPQLVRLKDIMYYTMVSSTGALQGTVLSPIVFAFYTRDFCRASKTCPIDKYSDDTANMECFTDDEGEDLLKSGEELCCLVPTQTAFSSSPPRLTN